MPGTPPATRPAGPEPMYFGPSGSLFGVFHPADRARARTVGIVLCHPAGHEHLRIQRTFRNLAVALARFGFPVLRFDYSGSGDSSGDGSAISLSGWQADLSAAIDDVMSRARVSRVALIGHRLGATLAWLESLRRSDIDLVVMWEPVMHGGRYIQQLRELESAWLSEPPRQGVPEARVAAAHLLGFPFPPAFEQELKAVDLAASPLPASAHVVALFDAVPRPEESMWRERLVAKYGATSSAVLPSGADWDQPSSIHTAVYAQAAVQAIPAMFDKVIV